MENIIEDYYGFDSFYFEILYIALNLKELTNE